MVYAYSDLLLLIHLLHQHNWDQKLTVLPTHDFTLSLTIFGVSSYSPSSWNQVIAKESQHHFFLLVLEIYLKI